MNNLLKTKNGIALLIFAAVIITIAVWMIIIPQKRYNAAQENQMTAADSTKNNSRIIDSRIIDSIDTAYKDNITRARMVETNVYIIDDFSEYYYGKLIESDSEEFSAPDKVEIYSKKNNRRLLSVKVISIYWGFNYESVDTNNKIKYEEQEVIIYEDFNFDGIKDFAFLDGNYSSYAYPSHKVYLILNHKFVYSKKLTNLVRQNLGLFDVDRERKILSIDNKSGCCYRDYKEYKVINNSPVLVFIKEEETKGDYTFMTTTKLLKNGKWSKKITKEKAYKDY